MWMLRMLKTIMRAFLQLLARLHCLTCRVLRISKHCPLQKQNLQWQIPRNLVAKIPQEQSPTVSDWSDCYGTYDDWREFYESEVNFDE